VARVDYDKQSQVFDRARSLTPEAAATWMARARIHLRGDVTRLLDLGAGTGRFSVHLADAFSSDVIGVEPSGGMLAEAAKKPHPHVRLIRGAAEALPLRSSSCDGAWLSNVIHHFDDFDAAARELRRVVVMEGPVMIRGAFAGRPIPSLYRFFPSTEQTVSTFPGLSDVIGTFDRAGFNTFSVERVEQLLAHSLTEMIERIRLRADTTLELLPDEEFEAGLAAMEAEAQINNGPVIDPLDLLIVR
jgi:SAM-dependent methyltransferase